MRRRSERKKSTDVASPVMAATVSRRSSRRSRKSPSLNEIEKNSDIDELQVEKEISGNPLYNTELSEENLESARKSITRNITPAKETKDPAKKKNKYDASNDSKIVTIPEEGNAAIDNIEIEKEIIEEKKLLDNAIEEKEITPIREDVQSKSIPEKIDCNSKEVLSDNQSKPFENNSSSKLELQLCIEKEKQAYSNDVKLVTSGTNQKIKEKELLPNVLSAPNTFNLLEAEENKGEQESYRNEEHIVDSLRIRKRKWLTKKFSEIKTPILAISTDSLKNLIADVHPVPLSDVQLDSSPEIEELTSEREEGEKTPSPDQNRRNNSIDKLDKSTKYGQRKTSISATSGVEVLGSSLLEIVQHSPSPPANQTSNVLYITNLVRPFTVMQLRGLLARTGKIINDRFWIDRIKSKCYVEYETEDEAIETRHALHGVRWPVSNPKCLNVEFGNKIEMDRAIESTKDDVCKVGQENRDNFIVGSGWNRDRPDIDEKKISRPVREWDVGKKENVDRDKSKGIEKRHTRDRELFDNREIEKNEKDRKTRLKEREVHSMSLSPARKIKKKENDPPLRLLDDLFRKTKSTPCIYWLPLTPEQIAEKEAFRQKRIEEHKERMRQKELEREKEREKERSRGNGRDREHKRNQSSDRRRSRSRDRRRY